jgi:hypothetical protein
MKPISLFGHAGTFPGDIRKLLLLCISFDGVYLLLDSQA